MCTGPTYWRSMESLNVDFVNYIWWLIMFFAKSCWYCGPLRHDRRKRGIGCGTGDAKAILEFILRYNHCWTSSTASAEVSTLADALPIVQQWLCCQEKLSYCWLNLFVAYCPGSSIPSQESLDSPFFFFQTGFSNQYQFQLIYEFSVSVCSLNSS